MSERGPKGWHIILGMVATIAANFALASCQLDQLETRLERIERAEYENRILLSRDTVITDSDTTIREVILRKP